MTLLVDTIKRSGSSIYFGKRFRQMLEDHLQFILTSGNNQVKMIGETELATLHRYLGDFYGFLSALNIEDRYHWSILRVNGFRSRFDLTEDLTHLIIPDNAFLDKLAQLSKEKRK